MSVSTEFISQSQAGQDRFVYDLLGHDFKGTFLDIGCSHPMEISNTYALNRLGWTGLAVDNTDIYALFYKFDRENEFIQENATTIVYDELKDFDYGSFDVDGATLDALKNALDQGLKFRVLTVEHNLYLGGEWIITRKRIRDLLAKHGYTMICEDVCHGGLPFEDWWVDIESVDKQRALSAVCTNKEGKDIRVNYTP